ncbi:MAG: indolepyruvate ferredoxin oxidoreductase [Bacteroidales bacterium]|jgi:indolepyruvate ferredoxin oxidoreductase alpha subunit|nr:indolepyruvate ferredoxin oxidoreductase [Bacteroidales bacterium]
MHARLLLGDEVIAQAAVDAGLSGIYAYPGTPSTEIMEYVQHSAEAKERQIHCRWSANEKTAMEAALGMSYCGKRAMACMKHVGLNVAADAFINSAVTGVGGGLLVVSADDPSMHSSQNEQDSRYYGNFALIPVLEPSNQQEAYDMTSYGFELSEKTGIPVLMRITTRMAHSRASVTLREKRPQNKLSLPHDPRQYVLLPVFARQRYKKLLATQTDLERESVTSGYNRFFDGTDTSLGIIACGIAYNYLTENFADACPHPVVKLSQYPVPKQLVAQLTAKCKKILVLEDGYPLVEGQLKGLAAHPGFTVCGRLDGTLPRDGELTPDIVARALALPVTAPVHDVPKIVAARPPAFCKGCGHTDLFLALNDVMKDYPKGYVFSDIGCYTLGALPPHLAINSCVDMGASITMAKGAADAGLSPSVAVIGDSTFVHSGMTGLLDIIIENAPVTVIISDNLTTGMTGGQPSSAYGKIEQICLGLGLSEERLKVLTPLKKYHNENVSALREAIHSKGTSVVVFRRECVQTAARRAKTKQP